MNFFTFIRYFNFGLALIATFIWILWYMKYREPIAIAAITWLAHVAIFLGVLLFISPFLEMELHQFFNDWSTALRLHGIILLIASAFIFRGNDRNGN